MNTESFEKFLSSCDDFITCKYLVAEYKLQKMLADLANCEEACQLIGDCLEQFNREREFAKTFVQNSYGDFVCVMPEEEYKILALVFCTLIDIDNKKIDFTDFVKRFFGREENSFKAFISTLVIPFRNLLAEAFGYAKINFDGEKVQEPTEEGEEEQVQEEGEETAEEISEEPVMEGDVFEKAEKIAVQILGELQFSKQDGDVLAVERICRAIIKTNSLKDEEITSALVSGLRFFKVKQSKFLIKELCELFK
jgi:hypothetical protein